jgi:perosamine synthetase
VARERGIAVIEDAAEAHGAEYRGRRVGGLGTVGCFSFFGNKIISTGEGGMVVTSDARLADRMRFLRGHAMDPVRRYWHTEIGFNYRMTNLQAAVGVAQLEEIDTIIARKLAQAEAYRELLRGVDVDLPPSMEWAKNVYWMFSVVMRREKRDHVIRELATMGVDTRPFFAPIHLMPMYGGRDGQFPVAESLSARGINLPSGPNLTRRDLEFTAERLKRVLKSEAAAPVAE